MLQVILLHQIRDVLDNPAVRETFCDIVSLRQECFSEVSPNALMLDAYDLIATHVAVYQTLPSKKLLGLMRIVNEADCLSVGRKLPLEEIVKSCSALHQQAFDRYRKKVNGPLNHMSIFAISKDAKWLYRSHGIAIGELVYWLCVKFILDKGMSSFCGAALNATKTIKWANKLGDLEPLPDILHPQVDGWHQLALAYPINKDYVASREPLFQELYEKAILYEKNKDTSLQAVIA